MISFSQRIGNARGFLYKGEGLVSSNRFLPESKIDRILQKARSAKAKEEYEKESTKKKVEGRKGNREKLCLPR